jgi:uncharacterized protein (DUF4415 family)
MKKQSLVDADDAPPLTGEELRRPEGKWRIGGKLVSAEEGKAAFQKAWRRKIRTNIHLDSDVIAHYKSLAGDRGYQTLINAALRRDMEGSSLKGELLQAMKAEFFETMKAELLASITERIVKLSEVTLKTSAIATPLTAVSIPGLPNAYISTYSAVLNFHEGGDPPEKAVTTANSNPHTFELMPIQGHA